LQTVDQGSATVGSDIEITADMAAVGGIVDPEVRFRRGGDPSFFSAPMQRQDDGSYAFSIPAFAVSDRGVEFSVQARDQFGTTTESARQAIPVKNPLGYPTVLAGGSDAASYRLLSVPGDLDEASVRLAMEDDLGPYDVSEWRFYRLEGGSRLVELSEQDLELEPGRSFWMLARADNLSVNPGAGTSISTAAAYPVTLSNGWNLIGDPFAFDVPISNLTTASGRGVDLWRYDGSWSLETTAIVPFTGYAIFSDGVDTLWIDPDLSPENVAANATNIKHRTSNTKPSHLDEQRSSLEALFGLDRAASGVLRAASLAAYPNPFGEAVTFEFDLPADGDVTVTVHDVLGRRVTTLLDGSAREAGRHAIRWDGSGAGGSRLAAGTYFWRMRVGESEETGVVVRTK
jgi:hypothetical protein